ncbi:glycoside hydrolase superfamily, partial [Naematelia encephala]
MSSSFLLALLSLLLCRCDFASSQSVDSLGSSGGTGPTGGIGDLNNPVKHPQAFVTDARISHIPNSTRQLAVGPAPRLLDDRGAKHSGCAERRDLLIDSTANGAKQHMVGFGHSWTGSTVSVFNNLDNDTFDQMMQELFGQDGNNMGFMRHTIGSSDLDGDQYSYDDNGPSFNEGEPDNELASFTIGPHGRDMLDMISRMGIYKSDVFLFGSPWSYPAWAKHNNLFIAPWKNEGSYSNIMNNSFNTRYIPQMTDYFTKYIDTYKAKGVTVNGITLMNEPLNSQGGYPCMYLDAVDQAALIAGGVGQAMRARGVKIMAYDHNTDQPMYPMRVMQGAPGLVDAAAWHCYQSPAANYTVLEDWHQAYPDTAQFMTECSNYQPKVGAYNWKVAQNFLSPVKYGASGASMWVMATDPNYGPHSIYGGCDGCSGSIIVNSSTVYTKTNDYYMVGHFSRFIRRGAVHHRILSGLFGTSMDHNQFDAIAIQNPDQSWAVIFMNNAGSDQDVVVSFKDNHAKWQGTIPNGTVTSWVLP